MKSYLLKSVKAVFALGLLSTLLACTTVSVDQVQLVERAELIDGDSIVVLGRNHSAEYETEPSLVSCVGRKLVNAAEGVRIISAPRFVDGFYPYFEPRVAPLTIERLQDIFAVPAVQRQLERYDLRYMVWIEGSTERTGGGGSMSCALSTAGGGCFGFSTWEDTSDYEAVVWDVQTFEEVGRVSTEAIGTSYMPAVVVPLPFIARVQANACEGMGNQLAQFFQGESSTLKVRPRPSE